MWAGLWSVTIMFADTPLRISVLAALKKIHHFSVVLCEGQISDCYYIYKCIFSCVAPLPVCIWVNQVTIETDRQIYSLSLMSVEDLEAVVSHVAASLKKIFPDSSPG